MKILLINPPYDIEEYYGKLAKLAFAFPPVGLLYIASFTRNSNHDVKIFDFQVEEELFEDYFNNFSPDLVGITCQTALVYNTGKLAEKIKLLKNIPIVVGGVHPTFRPEDLIKNPQIDFVVRGEGEKTFKLLIDELEKQSPANFSKIDGLVFKNKDQIITNKERAFIEDLNELPFPAIDLVPINKYHVSSDLYFGKKTALLSTARGCPFKCTFCAIKVIFKRTVRYRKLENIFQEIEYYVKNYQVDSLFIMDDIFTLNKKRVQEFCNFLIEKYDGKILWWAQTRADCVDKELLLLMKRAGCKILSFGVESGNERLLKKINKNINLSQVRSAVKLVKECGISPRGSFILGLPTETFKESIKTILFALTNDFDRAKFGLATPYPGTELWNLALEEGKISKDEDWNRFSQMAGYTHHDAPYIPDKRNSRELKFLQISGNLIFYLKPRIIFDFIKTYYKLGSMKKLFSSIRIFSSSSISRNKHK
jgi:anaerobic magnesium-protoporphyrin IX monomethyl ester cyclase